MSKALRLALVACALTAMAAWQCGPPGRPPGDALCAQAGQAARLSPDYVGLVVPPNIAPLNFVIAEPASTAWARFTDARGHAWWVSARHGQVCIPLSDWRAMLAASRDGQLAVDIFTRGAAGAWTRYAQPPHRVAAEPIDSHLVYRWFRPAVNAYVNLGIRQRDLTSFDESWVVHRDDLGGQCINCHTPARGRAEQVLFHTRPTNGGAPAMVVVRGGQARAIDTRAEGRKSAASYSSWHPSGNLIAFSYNKIHQFIWEASPQPKDAIDIASGLGLHDLNTGQTTTPMALNQAGRLATFPCWSPDGRWLYYASAPRPWPADDLLPLAHAKKVRYDLMRCAFDEASGQWGRPERVLAAADLGLSLIEPRVSPDGRWLLFVGCEYGSFPIFQRRTDLWLLDLSQPGARPRPVEPGAGSRRDSWHGWSTNGRWMVCASKRDNGAVARPYFRHVAADGTVSKAFVLPQRDPSFYDRCLETFNAPELQVGPSHIDRRSLKALAKRVGPPQANQGGPSTDYHGSDTAPAGQPQG